MIDVTYRFLGGAMLAKFTVENVKQLFDQVGEFAELLAGDDRCGMPGCGSTHIWPRSREAKKADGKKVKYYELVCGDCGAKLSYGQHSEGGSLWVKRANDTGPLDNRGWSVYRAIAAPAGERGGPPKERATQQPTHADDPALVSMLQDTNNYEKIIDDLFWSMADSLGEGKSASEPKTAAAWKELNNDKPNDATIIRRLFNWKVKL